MSTAATPKPTVEEVVRGDKGNTMIREMIVHIDNEESRKYFVEKIFDSLETRLQHHPLWMHVSGLFPCFNTMCNGGQPWEKRTRDGVHAFFTKLAMEHIAHVYDKTCALEDHVRDRIQFIDGRTVNMATRIESIARECRADIRQISHATKIHLQTAIESDHAALSAKFDTLLTATETLQTSFEEYVGATNTRVEFLAGSVSDLKKADDERRKGLRIYRAEIDSEFDGISAEIEKRAAETKAEIDQLQETFEKHKKASVTSTCGIHQELQRLFTECANLKKDVDEQKASAVITTQTTNEQLLRLFATCEDLQKGFEEYQTEIRRHRAEIDALREDMHQADKSTLSDIAKLMHARDSLQKDIEDDRERSRLLGDRVNDLETMMLNIYRDVEHRDGQTNTNIQHLFVFFLGLWILPYLFQVVGYHISLH